MSEHRTDEFERSYLTTWTSTETAERRAAIDAVWAPDGRMVVAPAGPTLHGIDEIDAHIAQVQERTVKQGMQFAYDQHAEADDALLLRWSMLAPNGATAGRGVDLVFRDDDGKARTVYMFMGVD